MAVDQYLAFLVPSNYAPILTEDGWKFEDKPGYPVEFDGLREVISRRFTILERKSGDSIILSNDWIEFAIALKPDGRTISEISLRLSLRKLNQDKLSEVVNSLNAVADECGLKIYDVYKKKHLISAEDLVLSIKESRPGKFYY